MWDEEYNQQETYQELVGKLLCRPQPRIRPPQNLPLAFSLDQPRHHPNMQNNQDKPRLWERVEGEPKLPQAATTLLEEWEMAWSAGHSSKTLWGSCGMELRERIIKTMRSREKAAM